MFARVVPGLCGVAWLAATAISVQMVPPRIERAVEQAAEEELRAASLSGFTVDVTGYDLAVSGEATHPVELRRIESVLTKLTSDFRVDVSNVRLPVPNTEAPRASAELRVSRGTRGVVVRGRVPSAANGARLVEIVAAVLGEPVMDTKWAVAPEAALPPGDLFATAVASLRGVTRGDLTWSSSGVTLVGQGSQPRDASVAQRLLHAVGESGVDVEARLTWPDDVGPWLAVSRDGGGVLASGVVPNGQRRRMRSRLGDALVDLTSEGATADGSFGTRSIGAIRALSVGAGHVTEGPDGLTVRGMVPEEDRTSTGSEIRRVANGRGLDLELAYLTDSCSAGLASVRVGSRDPSSTSDVAAVAERIESCPGKQFSLPEALGTPSTARSIATGRWMATLGEVGIDLRRIVSWDGESQPPL